MCDPAGVGSRSVSIALCLNDRFVPPARTLIRSIGDNGGDLRGVSLVVLTKGLASNSVSALEESTGKAGLPLHIRRVDDTSALGSIPSWAVETCLRLYVGEVCRDFDRVLYLDSDTLVLESLESLVDIDLSGRSAAAVVNHPPLDIIRLAIPRSRRGETPAEAPYFNAGVLLVDTAAWERHSLGERSRAFLRCFPETRLFDQDALNTVLVNDWLCLDKRWNVPAGPLEEAPMYRGLAKIRPSMARTAQEWRKAQVCPRILHFTGHPKPWEPDYPWPALRSRYRECAASAFSPDWPASRAKTVGCSKPGESRVHGFRRT